jgi:hypothetical protein
MNTYAVTGKFEPCPRCGSEDVRWRGRRWYDVINNNLRGFIEWGVAMLFRPRRDSLSYPIPTSRADELRLAAIESDALLNAHEYNTAFMTPRRYWKCRACRQRGEVYDDVLEQVMRERAMLGGIDERMATLDPLASETDEKQGSS